MVPALGYLPRAGLLGGNLEAVESTNDPRVPRLRFTQGSGHSLGLPMKRDVPDVHAGVSTLAMRSGYERWLDEHP